MTQSYLRTIILTSLGIYLLSLALGVFYKPAFDYFYNRPLRGFNAFLSETEALRSGEDSSKAVIHFYGFARDEGRGVVAWESGKTYGDYTFFFSAYDHKAYLVDLKGTVIHQWLLDAENLPQDHDHPQGKYPDAVWRAFLMPNGDVIALYCGTEVGVGTYVAKGIFKVDKDSRLLWNHRDYLHHDVKVLPNGNLLVFGEKMFYEPYKYGPHINPPYADDYLVTLNSKGEEIDRVSLLDLMAKSHLKKFIKEIGYEAGFLPYNGDIIHPNTIARVTAAAAARNPAFKEGQFLLSFRNFSMLVVVDLEQKKLIWASYGPWKGQHGTVFMPDGSLVMFDNLGNVNKAGGGLSRILNVDTATGEVLWEYGGTTDNPVFSPLNSSVDPLPNGNFLVTETQSGRIFEVTHDKELVWDYRSPQRIKSKQGQSMIPNLFNGKRYKREDLPFLGELEAEPGKPVNP